MTKTTSTLWTPGGNGSGDDRREVHLPPQYLQMVSILADTSADLSLGLHCSICGQDLVGKNAREDTRWMMECGCRTFVGANPLPRGH